MTEFYRLANQYRLTYQTYGSSNATSATFSVSCSKLPGKGLISVYLGVVVLSIDSFQFVTANIELGNALLMNHVLG